MPVTVDDLCEGSVKSQTDGRSVGQHLLRFLLGHKSHEAPTPVRSVWVKMPFSGDDLTSAVSAGHLRLQSVHLRAKLIFFSTPFAQQGCSPEQRGYRPADLRLQNQLMSPVIIRSLDDNLAVNCRAQLDFGL